MTPAAGSRFWKVIECDAFDAHPQGGAPRFRALFLVHQAYAAALAAAAHEPHDPPPSSLVAARLLFGAFAVLVDLPFVGSRAATADELSCARGDVLRAVAAAVAWLARRGLLYVDLRCQNVRVADVDVGDKGGDDDAPRAFLVDYDDMLLLPHPARSADELLAALRRDEHGAAALDSLPALEEALLAAWPQPAADAAATPR